MIKTGFEFHFIIKWLKRFLVFPSSQQLLPRNKSRQRAFISGRRIDAQPGDLGPSHTLPGLREVLVHFVDAHHSRYQ